VPSTLVDAVAAHARVLRDGWSALHISAKKNHTDMAQLLLQYGIDVDAKKKYNHTHA
jgi:ankyrin repeat protein